MPEEIFISYEFVSILDVFIGMKGILMTYFKLCKKTMLLIANLNLSVQKVKTPRTVSFGVIKYNKYYETVN